MKEWSKQDDPIQENINQTGNRGDKNVQLILLFRRKKTTMDVYTIMLHQYKNEKE